MKAIVIKPIAELHKEPCKYSQITDEVLFGNFVDILGCKDDYFLINTEYRYKGWLAKDALLFGNNAVQAWENQDKLMISAKYADVLSKTDVKAKRIISLPRACIIGVIGVPNTDFWQKVILPNEDVGYIKAEHLRRVCFTKGDKSEAELRNAVYKNALLYLGTQYRWGGKTPLGIDCSGLVSMAYLQEGIAIYRDAKIELGFPVHEINIADIQKGDLLYFPGHVAMYIGKGNFVHATSHGEKSGVVLASLNSNNTIFREDLSKTIIKAGSIF
ncbi:MAG: C40 family peptidase [Oscillospiraceae bacterium]